MTKHAFFLLALFAVAALVALPAAGKAKGPAYDDPAQAAKADPDFLIQGEYAGELGGGDEKGTFGVQVIALGDGKFQAVGYDGGLPGAGWNQEEKPERVEGELKDGAVRFEGEHGVGVLKDGVITVTNTEGKNVGQLKKVNRQSPTLGAKPPQGAKVLFGDAKDVDNWKGGRVTEDGLLMQGITSHETFQDHKLHLEFRLPYQPQDRGQRRGNSGLYVQGRYEVQMLDSFGLEGLDNECGGIYKIARPKVNMCLPPLTWQTYDVEFTAAKFDASGEMTRLPKMTVHHNGVLIHKDLELPKGTQAGPLKPGKEPGPVYLQNHGNPVRYRNIWVEE